MSKKNKGYWTKRQTQWIKNQDKSDKAVTNRLKSQYGKTARQLENDIAGYFKRYGKDDVLEYREMLKDLNEKDRNLLYQDMETFALRYPDRAHLLPVRESIYKLNRLQGLHYSSQLKLLELGVIEQEVFEKHLIATYGTNYEALMSELGIGNSFLSVSDDIARSTAYTKWVNGKNFSDRIWDNKEKLTNFLQSDYRNALIRGDSYDRIIAQLIKRMGVGAYDARRLVWTESSFVLNQAHTHPYMDIGVEEYELNAFMDNKTSQICRKMDGEVFRFDEIEVGVNFPPFHSFCRTTFIGKDIDKLLD